MSSVLEERQELERDQETKSQNTLEREAEKDHVGSGIR